MSCFCASIGPVRTPGAPAVTPKSQNNKPSGCGQIQSHANLIRCGQAMDTFLGEFEVMSRDSDESKSRIQRIESLALQLRKNGMEMHKICSDESSKGQHTVSDLKQYITQIEYRLMDERDKKNAIMRSAQKQIQVCSSINQ